MSFREQFEREREKHAEAFQDAVDRNAKLVPSSDSNGCLVVCVVVIIIGVVFLLCVSCFS